MGAGILLAAVIKPLGKKEIIFRTDDYSEPLGKEAEMLEAVISSLSKFDLWIGHNINRFDVMWLRSRAVQLGLDSFPMPFTYDTMQAFKRCGYLTVQNAFGKPTKRLDHVVDFFKLPQEKTALYPNEHWSIVWGDKAEKKAALDKLVDHCRKDVRMNAAIYPLLLRSDYRGTIKRIF